MKMKFNPDREPIRLTSIANEERLLHLALRVFTGDCEEQELLDTACDIIHWYILRKYQKEQRDFTEEDMAQYLNELVSGFILDNLVAKGLLEEEFEISEGESIYKLTYLGKQVAKELKENE